MYISNKKYEIFKENKLADGTERPHRRVGEKSNIQFKLRFEEVQSSDRFTH